MRFLIVDDSSTMRRMIINTLTKCSRLGAVQPRSRSLSSVLGPRSSVYGPQSLVMTVDRGLKTVDRVHLIHAIAVRPPLSGLRRGS